MDVWSRYDRIAKATVCIVHMAGAAQTTIGYRYRYRMMLSPRGDVTGASMLIVVLLDSLAAHARSLSALDLRGDAAINNNKSVKCARGHGPVRRRMIVCIIRYCTYLPYPSGVICVFV